MRAPQWMIVSALLLTPLFAAGCGGDEGTTGAACEATSDCYTDIDVEGDPVCFTEVKGGYCSHTCESVDDCCAVEGECRGDFDYRCTGLEQRTEEYCFIDCAASNGSGGDQSICDEVADDLECRNTGRGTGSHACLPPGGD